MTIELEKAYIEDLSAAYKESIRKSNKWRYWLRKRVDEDERSITQQNTPIPQFQANDCPLKLTPVAIAALSWQFIKSIAP